MKILNSNDMDNSIKGIIDRIEGDKAIISLEDGQKLNWRVEKLPKASVEGNEIKIFIAQNEISEADEKNLLAKNILNEILDVEE